MKLSCTAILVCAFLGQCLAKLDIKGDPNEWTEKDIVDYIRHYGENEPNSENLYITDDEINTLLDRLSNDINEPRLKKADIELDEETINTMPPPIAKMGVDPDIDKRTPDIIQMRGWGVELHYPVTEDGYILGLHRIIHPDLKPEQRKRPIILQHGLLSSSICWVINDPNTGLYGEKPNDEALGNNLGFELAKRGYDVWLGNSRGNLYSTNHTSLNTKSREFWDFDFDQMIKFDVPTTIEYVRNQTGSAKIGWVGHSQGTMIMFGFLSRNPEYSMVIEPFVALAPVAYVSHTYSPARVAAYQKWFINLYLLKGGPFLPDRFITAFASRFCRYRVLNYVCEQALFLITGGYESSQLNLTRMAVYAGDESVGTSVRNMAHFGQSVRTTFANYDFGRFGNLAQYGSPNPPLYDMSAINCTSMTFISSLGDALGDKDDLENLLKDLQVKLVKHVQVPSDKFTHIDFIWGNQAGDYVNKPVVEAIKSYAPWN